MKVLFLINNLAGGGAERVLVNLVNQLAEDPSYEITLRTLVDTGENKAGLSEKVTYEFVFKRSFRGLNYLYLLPHQWIYRKVAGGNYDIVVAYLHGVLTRIVSYAPDSQRTVAFLHANMERSPFMRSFRSREEIRKCFSGFDRIISVSQSVQESFVRASGIYDDRLAVKYNTFDLKHIIEGASEQVSDSLESTGTVKFCTVGKLEQVKGYGRLLRTLADLKKEGLSFYLTIVGDGSQREELRKYIDENMLSDSVKLVGFDSNPYKYIARSDCFVCSSYSEGFSSVVAESLILGVPVLTTECAGMREMLGDNEYGIIVANNDDALRDGLRRFITDPALRSRYRDQAGKRAGFFEPEQTIGAIKQMFEELT